MANTKSDADSREHGERLRRRLNARTLLAMAMLGVVIVAAQHYTYGTHAQRLDDAELINRLGRQRMLTQRIAKAAALTCIAPESRPAAADELAAARDELSAELHFLASWAPEGMSRHRQAEFASLAAELDGPLQQIERLSAKVERAAISSDASDAFRVLASLNSACDEYCSAMERATASQSRHVRDSLTADTRTRTLIQVGLFAGIAMLTVFLVIPSIAHAAKSQERLVHELRLSHARQDETEALAAKIRRMSALDHAVLDTAADSIVVIGPDGIIQQANAAAHRTFCAEPGQLIGINVSNLMPAPHSDRHDGYLDRYMETRERHVIGTTRELEACRLNGERFPMELSVASTVVDGQNYFTGFVRDVTERKKLESRLLQSEKLSSVGRLASGIAHEMNTPLQFISVNTEYLETSVGKLADSCGELLEGLGDGFPGLLAEIQECVQENQDGIGRLVEIVQSMKEFSHPGDSNSAGFDINRCLNSVTVISRNRWKHIAKLELNLGDDLPPCGGSSNEISQVLLNLIVNAADAIQEQRGVDPLEVGRIVLTSSLCGDHLRITVEDDGPGIPADVLPHIFDPFYTTKPVGQGTGQGLAIAYDIVVTKHGGELTSESAQGEGSRFTVSLPLFRLSPDHEDVDSCVAPSLVADLPITESPNDIQAGVS